MVKKILNDPKTIMLGKGVFSIDGTFIGATQGGGKLSIKRETRSTQIDGAPGRIKGMDIIETSEASLEINHLEIINDDIRKRHPGLVVKKEKNDVGDNVVSITGNMKIYNEDYHDVSFIGETKAGKEISITIHNAINLENIEFDLKEKSEVIDKCTYISSFDLDDESDDMIEPWEITYIEGENV